VFLAGREGLPVVCIQRVPEPKSGKTRIHLDLSVEDLDAATQRIVELGGSWDAWSARSRNPAGGPWPTLRGPSSTSPWAESRLAQSAWRSRKPRMNAASARPCSGGTAL